MKIVRRRRGTLALLVLSLVVPRLLVPMGYMPGTDARGRPAIVFCDEAGRAGFAGHRAAADHMQGSMAHHHHGGDPAPPAHAHHSSNNCPFGMSIGPAEFALVTVASAALLSLTTPPAKATPVADAPSVAANGPRAPPSV